MSSAPDAPAAPAHAHDDHDAFDGEPARELSPGEPRSPAWLPVLGVALFSAAAVYMLTGSSDGAVGSAPTATPKAPAPEAAQAAPPPEARPQPAQPVPTPAAPAGTGPNVRKMSPEQVQELQKKIQDARAKGALPQRPAPGK